MFKIDIKYCPWADSGIDDSWSIMRADIPTEKEALKFADDLALEYSQCLIRITDENHSLYETTIRSKVLRYV